MPRKFTTYGRSALSLLTAAFFGCLAMPGDVQAQAVANRKFTQWLGREGENLLRFDCSHIKNVPRDCDISMRVHLSGKSLLFIITRQYIADGVIEDSASIAAVDTEPSRDRHVSLWLGTKKVADGDVLDGYGERMNLVTRDFLNDAKTATSATIEVVEGGRRTTFQVHYRAELAECITAGTLSTDREFDAFADRYGGRATCDFYAHLGKVVVSTQAESSALLTKEIAFLKARGD